MLLRNLFLTLFAVCALANASSLDEVKPIDEDQAIRLRVVAPDHRVLPSQADRKPAVSVFHGTSKRIITLYPQQAEAKDSLEGQVPLAAGEAYSIYYQAPNGSSAYNLKLFASKMDKSLVTHTIYMKRIDVHHITVTRPDGTKYVVKGDFKLAKVKTHDKDEEISLGAYPTGVGIDVPSGFRYRVIVSGMSEDGPTSYKAELDFTKD